MPVPLCPYFFTFGSVSSTHTEMKMNGLTEILLKYGI